VLSRPPDRLKYAAAANGIARTGKPFSNESEENTDLFGSPDTPCNVNHTRPPLLRTTATALTNNTSIAGLSGTRHNVASSAPLNAGTDQLEAGSVTPVKKEAQNFVARSFERFFHMNLTGDRLLVPAGA
jgi:hypothetical protein